uniref:Protein THEM6 n=2 Tax=Gouania willdenowi TaxID=441366 RepID=A0A8C5EZ03_GOUWI
MFLNAMDWLMLLLFFLLIVFCCLDVCYFLRAAAVFLWAWFQRPIKDITAEQLIFSRVSTSDIDLCHMNNARYLRECDFARFSLLTRNGVFSALRALKASAVVGASTARYRRPLCLGEAFGLRSRVVCWDDKAFYLEHRFISSKDHMVSAVVFIKMNIIRTSPENIMEHLCKRKVERVEVPEDLQHWISFMSVNSESLRAESKLS